MDDAFSQIRVFLVEDETIVLEDLKEGFSSRGYTVVGTARSSEEAIESIKESKPDLIIMDVKIAGELNGIEVAMAIQSFFGYRLPIVFLTGFQENGFDSIKVTPECVYIAKPFQERELFEAVERILEVSANGKVWNTI